MKIFNIPKWDTDSGLTHYATTWVISLDKDGFKEIYRVDKSSDLLLGIDVNIIPLIGEVYYIKALRHLNDSDGNDVGYTAWAGPVKLINNDSNKNDVFIPKTYINMPYVTNIDITADDGLIMTLAPVDSNVLLLSTRVIIESDTGTEVYSKIFDKDVSEIIISNDDYNFTSVGNFIIKIMYIGEYNTVSQIFKKRHSYVSELYTLVGSLKLLDTTSENIIKILPINDSDISVVTAEIVDIGNTPIVACTVNDNIVTIPVALKHNYTYKLMLELSYTDPVSNETKTFIKEHYFTTDTESEAIFFKDMSYTGMSLISEDNDPIIDNVIINTEQSLYGVIPFIDKGVLKLFINDTTTNSFKLLKDTGIDIPNSLFKIDFLPNNKLVIFYGEDTNNMDIRLYRYNYYTDELSLITTINDVARYDTISTNSFTLINDRYYFYDYNDESALVIKYLSLIDDKVYDYKELTLPDLDSFTFCNVTLIDFNKVLIVPKSTDVVFTYVYDFINDEITIANSIPDNFRNIDLMSRRLLNGDILYTKVNENNNKEYMIYDHITNTLNYNTFDVNTDKYFNINISLKSGAYYMLTYEDDDKLDIYKYE